MGKQVVAEGVGVAVILGFLYYEVLPFFNRLMLSDPQNALLIKVVFEIGLLGMITVILPVVVIDRAYSTAGMNLPQDDPKELPAFGFGFGALKPHINWIITEATKQGAVDLVRMDSEVSESDLTLEGVMKGNFLPTDVNGVPYIHIGTGKRFTIPLTVKKEEEVLAHR